MWLKKTIKVLGFLEHDICAATKEKKSTLKYIQMTVREELYHLRAIHLKYIVHIEDIKG